MPILKKTFLILLATLVLAVLVIIRSPLQTINLLTPGDAYRKSENLAYGADPRQKLDVYSPKQSNGLMPVVIFFYGGRWNSGERSDYAFVGEALAERGMVAVLADYRLYPQVRYPGFVEDAARAVAWTAREVQKYGGDPKRLFLMGHSAGAYNVAMVALDQRWLAPYGMAPSALRGWVGLAGPYDFIPVVDLAVRPIFFYPSTPQESQPINHVSAGAPPALLIAAQDDDLVDPVRNTGGLAKSLRAAGVRVEEFYSDKAGHSSLIAMMFRPLRGLVPVLDLTEVFVKSGAGRPMPGHDASLPAAKSLP